MQDRHEESSSHRRHCQEYRYNYIIGFAAKVLKMLPRPAVLSINTHFDNQIAELLIEVCGFGLSSKESTNTSSLYLFFKCLIKLFFLLPLAQLPTFVHKYLHLTLFKNKKKNDMDYFRV